MDSSSHQANATTASFGYSAELLIDATKMYPYLYDKRHPSFKDRTKKDRAWADRSMFGMSTATSQQKRLTRDYRLGQDMQRNRNVPLIRLRRLVSTPAAMTTTSREQPPSKRSRSSRRQRTCEGASNAGEGTSHEAVAQACMEHLDNIRANKGVIKKDNIGFFALRTDARLRELPVHIAQDVMHAVELMLYEAEAKLRQSSEAN
ncbi:hypothetical protein MRX96_002137 [Rhipicephalus microplus]